MKTFSRWLMEATNRYYLHGSMDYLPEGTILTPRSDYRSNWGDTDFYKTLERYRPQNKLAHHEAVFMVDNDEDIDNAGGGTEWIFYVMPLGPVERHDMNWSSEISSLEPNVTEEQIKEIANAYWQGVPHPDESVWEYLTPKAKIVKVEKY